MKMNPIKFAELISFVTQIYGNALSIENIEEINNIIDNGITPDPINHERLVTLFKFMENGELINAVKEYRSITNSSLRDAKEAVEMLIKPRPI